MAYEMLLNERDIALDIQSRRPALKVRIGDVVRSVAEGTAESGAFSLSVDGHAYHGWRALVGDEVFVRLHGKTYVVGLPQAQLRAHVHGGHDSEIRADMPGTMIQVHVEAGAEVKAGDRLVTIESMKLQVSLTASRDGVIEKIHVPAETAFDRGAVLVSFVKAEAEAAPVKA
jgi:3-methylcrotonyl-CoA carboxylase alpha subunit